MENAGQDREQGEVTPLRAEERGAVRAELESRLGRAGVALTGEESDDQIATLADAVERFEDAVIAAGGDRFVDDAASSRPEHPEHVLPRRGDDEGADAYVRRVLEAASRVTPQ